MNNLFTSNVFRRLLQDILSLWSILRLGRGNSLSYQQIQFVSCKWLLSAFSLSFMSKIITSAKDFYELCQKSFLPRGLITGQALKPAILLLKLLSCINIRIFIIIIIIIIIIFILENNEGWNTFFGYVLRLSPRILLNPIFLQLCIVSKHQLKH